MASIDLAGLSLPEAERTALEQAARDLPAGCRVTLTARATPPFVVEISVEGPEIEAVFGGPAIVKTVRGGDFEALVASLEEVRSAYDVGRSERDVRSRGGRRN